jgi:hypothetical protein
MRHVPIRTCVGCGARDAQAALVRVVAGPAGLAPDPSRRAGGRGAYLHSGPACCRVFARRRGPVRSLGTSPSRIERERLLGMLGVGPVGEGTR